MIKMHTFKAAMNAENPGTGDQLRMKCESGILRLCNTYGWQI